MVEQALPIKTHPVRMLLARFGRVAAILLLWLGLFGVVQWYAANNGLTLGVAFHNLMMLCATDWYGPLIFLAVAAVCPLLLVPAALLGLLAGHVYGVAWGMAATLVACNLSATVAYGLGSWLAGHASSTPGTGRVARYRSWMQQNGVLAVIVLRLTFVPYDPVSYLAGALHIGWLRFVWANTLGCLPGALALVLFGASMTHVDGSLPSLNPTILLAGLGLLLVSGGAAWAMRRGMGTRT
ncbi:MAG: VTT domain-containing protein [Chloroflexaceae bacterium]|jgi:uncharacterized membrane protein YdjX (TVP38/TMEM64 family)|nr:VTT domain-containing protein [Chloroflexaceae bacterium]